MSETVWIAGDGRSNYPYARAAVVAREPGEDGAVTVQPADGSPAVAIPAAAAHRANPLGQRADNCELLYLNEACVLANIAERYEQKAIYTWTSRVLVSVNPYEELKIYGERLALALFFVTLDKIYNTHDRQASRRDQKRWQAALGRSRCRAARGKGSR